MLVLAFGYDIRLMATRYYRDHHNDVQEVDTRARRHCKSLLTSSAIFINSCSSSTASSRNARSPSARPSAGGSLSASVPPASVSTSRLLPSCCHSYNVNTNVFIEGFTECTPKSIENRLYSWKKKNTATTTGSGDAPASTPRKAAPKPKKEPTTPKAKTPRAKKGAAKKKGDGEADGELTPSAGRKRSAESGEAGEETKVKVEQGVDDEDGAGEPEEEV